MPDVITNPVPDTNPSYDLDYQVPWTAGPEFITPEDAKQMLDVNRKNRNLMTGAVLRIKGIIDRHEWMHDSTDAIGLASDGAVVNGQHRLQSVADGDQGVWCLVIRGVRPEIINVIDQGMGRSLAQTLQIDGSYADPHGTAQAVEWAYKMVGGYEKRLTVDAKPTVPQLLELLAAHPAIVDSLEPAAGVRSKFKGLQLGVWAAYHYAFSAADAEGADEFFTQLSTGLNVGDSDPVYTLRERLIKNQVKGGSTEDFFKPWQVATLLVRAWEATRAGEKIPAKLFAKAPVTATQVPTVTGVSWLGTAEPAHDEQDEQDETGAGSE
jgi:hypothetical protein